MTLDQRIEEAKQLLALTFELADRLTELILDELWEKYHPGEDRPRPRK